MEGITERIRNAACTADILNAREDYLRLYSEYHTMSARLPICAIPSTPPMSFTLPRTIIMTRPALPYTVLSPIMPPHCSILRSARSFERELSPLLFRSMELQRKAISPVIVDDMVEENRLISEYPS